jgi:hypothetical protein
MKRLIQTPAIALCVLATTSAHAQSPGEAIMPGQLFEGGLLNVRAPDSSGWLLAGAGNNGMAFARRGTDTNETYAAQVILFKLPPTQSNAEFVEAIKSRVDMVNPPSRFVVLEVNYEYTNHRSYPCVRYKSVYDDKEALTTSGTHEALKLQVISLYCRHPIAQEVGFFAAYSHRGVNTDPNLEAPAQSFIDSVQVPAQK